MEKLRAVDAQAANRYIEHVVVIKRNSNRQLHEALLTYLLSMATVAVEDEGIKYHLQELGVSSMLVIVYR